LRIELTSAHACLQPDRFLHRAKASGLWPRSHFRNDLQQRRGLTVAQIGVVSHAIRVQSVESSASSALSTWLLSSEQSTVRCVNGLSLHPAFRPVSETVPGFQPPFRCFPIDKVMLDSQLRPDSRVEGHQCNRSECVHSTLS
jgi:hypothetical protein